MKYILPLLLLLSYSTASTAQDYILTIKPLLIEDGLNTVSTLAVKPRGNKLPETHTIKGAYTKWNCTFGAKQKINAIGVTCSEYVNEQQSSKWAIITDLHCDSKINLVIGSLMMTCIKNN